MKDEDKTFENERQFMKEVDDRVEDRGPLDLTLLVEEHRKELYAMQKYKSEAIMLANQLKGTKAIVIDFAKVIRELKEHNLTQAKEIDRLNEYVQILEMEKKTN